MKKLNYYSDVKKESDKAVITEQIPEEEREAVRTEGLYVVATPIGNLNDFSPRAVEILKNVSFIAAEDTRNSIKLLNRFDIHKELLSYHAHNIAEKSEYLTERMLSGESCALISDAGTPAISDPGEELVALCHKKGIRVTPVPGPSAVITALSASGMPTGRFTFEGFLSTAPNSRRDHLASLKDERRTMVFYEAPHKLRRTLSDLYAVFGDREMAIARELTKYYEEIIRTTIGSAIEKYKTTEPIGEFVLIVGGKTEADELPSMETAEEIFNGLVKGGMSKGDAVKETAKMTGIRKNELYEKLAAK